MAKIFVVTDTHFGYSGSSELVLEQFLSYFEEQFFPAVEREKPIAIFHLGDLMDRRKETNHFVLEAVKERFIKRIRRIGIPFYIIPGNHDTFTPTSNKINSLNLILPEVCPTIRQIHTTQVVNVDGIAFRFVPWISHDNKQMTVAALSSGTDKANTIVAGHFELNGFVASQGHLMETGMESSFLDGYPAVWSGHFHIRQTGKKIVYIGTPYQQTFGDVGSPQGYGVFDTDVFRVATDKVQGAKDALTFVDNKNTRFEKVSYGDFMDLPYDQLEAVCDSFNGKKIKLVVKEVSDVPKYEKFMALISKKVASVDIQETPKYTIEQSVSLPENNGVIDTPQMICSVVDKLPEEPSVRSELKSLLLDIHSDAISRTK